MYFIVVILKMEGDKEEGFNDKPEIGLEVQNDVLKTQAQEGSEEERTEEGRIQENGIEEQDNKTENINEKVGKKLIFQFCLQPWLSISKNDTRLKYNYVGFQHYTFSHYLVTNPVEAIQILKIHKNSHYRGHIRFKDSVMSLLFRFL